MIRGFLPSPGWREAFALLASVLGWSLEELDELDLDELEQWSAAVWKIEARRLGVKGGG